MRSSRSAPERAIGDNFLFEERVSDERRIFFENFDASAAQLAALHRKHFNSAVQGVRRNHIPTTFQVLNNQALYEPDIEPNQKLIRLERIDDILNGAGQDYAALRGALSPRDDALISTIVDQWKIFPGARPSFVAFKSELDEDLQKSDWITRLRDRLGLGHFSPAPGERQSFALMEYKVRDVLDEWAALKSRGVERPFAFPTVLEAPGSPHYFPSPAGSAAGFTIDLTETEGNRPPIREFLHIRLNYRTEHLVRVGQLVGPMPEVRLGAARDAHLDKLRRQSGRTDFGLMMAGEADE
jgi:hypothetical protein